MNPLLDAFRTNTDAIPTILQYNELAGETYFRFLVGGVDADGEWTEDNVIRLPGAYLQFQSGKDPVHVNYAMTNSTGDPILVLGWDNPSEERVANVNPALKPFKQPSKVRNYIPVVTCEGPKDKTLDGTPNLLALSDAQMRTLRTEVRKLGDSSGGDNDPLGMLLKFTVDAKAKKPSEKYLVSVAFNASTAKPDEYAEKLKAVMPLFTNIINNETRLCGGPNVWVSDPNAAAANVWAHIESETSMTKEQIIDRYYVGMNPKIDPTPSGESLTNPEVDFK